MQRLNERIIWKNELDYYIKTRQNLAFVFLGTFAILLFVSVPQSAFEQISTKYLWLVVSAVLIYIGNLKKDA